MQTSKRIVSACMLCSIIHTIIQTYQHSSVILRLAEMYLNRAQSAAAIDEVEELLSADNPYHRARAVWLLAQLGPEGIEEVEQVLRSASNPRLRIAAFRALRPVSGQEKMLGYARQLAGDSSPAVRRAVAVALRGVPIEKDGEIILELAGRYGGEDRWMLEAIGLAAEGDEAAVYELLKGDLGGADPAKWSEAWADLVWRLHPAAAAEELKARALAPSLGWEEQEQALVALGFIKGRAGLKAMEALSASAQEKVAERAQWWLEYRSANIWHDLKDWQAAGREPAEERVLEEVQQLKATVLGGRAPTEARAAAAAEMARSPQGGRLLMSFLPEVDVPGEVQQAIKAHIFENPDRTVRVLARRYFEPSEREEAYVARRVVRLESDREQGQMLFYSKCAMCHRIGKAGGDVGPELTSVKTMFNREGLAGAILRPSSGIAHGYYPWQVITEGGDVIYGFLLAENEETIVIKDDNGQEHVIGRDRIASRKRLDVSLMPGPTELNLSPQDVADLVEFLATFEAK